MAQEAVHPELVNVALDRVEGSQFERFVNDFLPQVVGGRFVPLGGTKDGGADAFDGDPVHEEVGRPTTFYQASVREDFQTKVRQTIVRLREFGREPKTLIYVTSRSVRLPDIEERSLSDELDVTIKIRDAAYIRSQVNAGVGTVAAFNHHLRHLTAFLRQVGAASIIAPSEHVRSPAVYVFLEQELARRKGDTSLVDVVTDSLALWALEGTDPDAGLFMSREDVLEKISREIPAVRNVVSSRLGGRLEQLSGKQFPGGRQVKWHRRPDVFCLPYETRRRIEEENLADETLRLQVLDSLYTRLRTDTAPDLGDIQARTAAEVTLRALQMAFEREGLEFASFLENKNNTEYTIMTDVIAASLDERSITGKGRIPIAEAVFVTLRRVFYDSAEIERAYLGKLSRTYTLLFTLNTEPRLIEFFQQLTGELHLYVGADLLVRALSERYLSPPDQLTRRTLVMATRLGAKLILTEPVLGEVLGNLRGADTEFRNYFETVEYHVNDYMAQNASKIMVRSYFYARLDPKLDGGRPASWPGFVSQFCPYNDLYKPAAAEHLRRYLSAAFSMTFQSTEELLGLVSSDQVDELGRRLSDSKRDERLAWNDALMALAVYGRRAARREDSQISEFGFETWWLTSETAILRHTNELVKSHRGVRYMMRPDFLLNFMTLAPNANEARQTLGHVFPSMLGIRLGRRMDEDAFHKIMTKVAEAQALEDARRTAAIAHLSDQLKSTFNRQYGGTARGIPKQRMDCEGLVRAPVRSGGPDASPG